MGLLSESAVHCLEYLVTDTVANTSLMKSLCLSVPCNFIRLKRLPSFQGNMNEKKAGETRKLIRLLKSPKTPLVKLRQAMRTTFGDYRSKMAADEQKHRLVQAKAVVVAKKPEASSSSSSSSSKSLFVKKSASQAGVKQNGASSGQHKNEFRFGFAISQEDS